ncbi:MAG: prepilin-type N-terminal cleavage/methylation domain-containing protein [Gemmatimonadaceae bacterium]
MPSDSRNTRRGVTLVEVIVALVILLSGVLSLAATGVRLQALGASARQRMVATARATSVLDSLRSVSCRSVVSGADSALGVRVSWVVQSWPASRHVSVRADFSDHTSHTIVVDGAFPCE